MSTKPPRSQNRSSPPLDERKGDAPETAERQPMGGIKLIPGMSAPASITGMPPSMPPFPTPPEPPQPQMMPTIPTELLEWGRGVREDLAAIRALLEAGDPTRQLEVIRLAHVEYEAALSRREHGAVAADQFIRAVAAALAEDAGDV